MPDESENIKLHLIPYSAIDNLLQGSRLCNAPVIMAMQWLQQHVATLKNV